MADNIVGGLFGVNPQQLMQQRQTIDASNAFRYAQLDPLEQAKMSIYQGGAGLARGVGGLLGGDPELEKVSAIKQLSSQFDLSSATGMRDFARSLQSQYPQEAMLAAKRADELETSNLGRQQIQTNIQRTEGTIAREDKAAAQNEQLRAELSDAVQRGAPRQEITRIAAKYGSADKILQVLSQEQSREDALAARLDAKNAAAGDGGIGKPGPVGKAGAYRDADGIIYSGSEMAKQRAGFQALEKFADTLNSITSQDTKDAESMIDFTQGETLKSIGGTLRPTTIKAQAKINASQLLKQIESLPPGSASNADMIAAKSSFPGYGNAENLDNWIRDTKTLLAASLQRQSEQYGFKSKVTVKGLTPDAGAVNNAEDPLGLRKKK
jgi:hypothetical protein